VATALQTSLANYGGAKVLLVTNNSKHLPHSAFASGPVRVAKANTVLKELFQRRPQLAGVLDAMLGRFKNPKMDRADWRPVNAQALPANSARSGN